MPEHLTIAIEDGPNPKARAWAARFLAVRLGLPFRLAREAESDGPLLAFGRTAPGRGVFIRDSGYFDDRPGATHPRGERVSFEEVPLPFGRECVERKAKHTVIEADILASLFYLANRMEETRPVKTDEHGRFPAAASFLGSRDALDKPAAEIWAAFVADELRRLYPGLDTRPRWGGQSWAVCISHDIETLAPIRRLGYMKGRLLKAVALAGAGRVGDAARSVYSGLSRLASGAAPSWSFEHLRAGERPACGTYFFFGLKTSEKDGEYDVSSEPLRGTMTALSREGCELSLHLGYESGCDVESMREQKASLERAAGIRVRGARHHYLRADFPACWKAHEEAGFDYDASLGFAEAPGFRGASALPYRPFDLEADRTLGVYALPLVAMDGTFFDYMGLSVDQAVAEALELAEAARAAGGVFTLLWHNTMADPFDKPAQSRAYRAVTAGLRNMDARWLTAAECVAAWREYEGMLEVEVG